MPEDVGKADQLKDEGKYCLQRLLSASLETAALRGSHDGLRCQDCTVVIPVALVEQVGM